MTAGARRKLPVGVFEPSGAVEGVGVGVGVSVALGALWEGAAVGVGETSGSAALGSFS